MLTAPREALGPCSDSLVTMTVQLPACTVRHHADGQLSIFLLCLEQIPLCYHSLEQSQCALEARGSKDVFTGKTVKSSSPAVGAF